MVGMLAIIKVVRTDGQTLPSISGIFNIYIIDIIKEIPGRIRPALPLIYLHIKICPINGRTKNKIAIT